MAQTFNTNLKTIASTYLRLLNVKLTRDKLETSLEEHPFYPTLYSLSDTFSNYKIPNYAMSLTTAELEELNVPYLAYASLPEKGQDFVIVKSYSNDKVELIMNGTEVTPMPTSEFLARYRNVVLVAEPDINSGDPDFSKNLLNERRQLFKKFLLIAGLITSLFYLFFMVRADLPLILGISFLCSKLLGLTVASLLVQFELAKDNSLMRSVCSIGRNINCEAVVLSRYSKILGIPWSLIGWTYFFGSLLMLLTPTLSSAEVATIVSGGALVCVPFIFYSVYFQGVKIKEWCPMCLIVATLLAFEGILSFWYLFSYSIRLDTFKCLTAIIICLIAAVIAATLFKRFLTARFEARTMELAYKRLQFNPDIFQGLLESQQSAAIGWEHLGLTLGASKATTQIIKVCNPFCKPCSKSHLIFHKILDENPNVALKIIFNVPGNIDFEKASVVKLFLALQKLLTPKEFMKMLDDWYAMEDKNYEVFSATQPRVSTTANYNADLNAMYDWCKESEITYTPTIFVNGRRLPEYFDIDSLPKMKL